MRILEHVFRARKGSSSDNRHSRSRLDHGQQLIADTSSACCVRITENKQKEDHGKSPDNIADCVQQHTLRKGTDQVRQRIEQTA